MKLLLKLILNRFILSILLIFFFAIDFKFIRLNPMETYSFSRPPITSQANGYYIVELGEPEIYIEVFYQDGKIHLVPTSNTPSASTPLIQPLVDWYYYALALALVNIIPFRWFTKTKKVKKRKK